MIPPPPPSPLFPYTTLFRSPTTGRRTSRRDRECLPHARAAEQGRLRPADRHRRRNLAIPDRKSTRLNSSHVKISYAVFCLKKKKPTRADLPVRRGRLIDDLV